MINCLCPPDTFEPSIPTLVFKPSGNFSKMLMPSFDYDEMLMSPIIMAM